MNLRWLIAVFLAVFVARVGWADTSLVLVTGANGFIGSSVVKFLLKKGLRVRGLVRKKSDRSSLSDIPSDLPLALVEGDLNDEASLRAAVEGVQYIVHTAGYVSDWGEAETYYRANVAGVENLLEAARRVPGLIRFVHFSTVNVLGLRRNARLNDEGPLSPSGYLYPDTKIQGETAVTSYQRAHGVPTTILRPSMVFGPGDKTFFPELIQAIQTRQFVYLGSPRKKINLVYIGNVVEAVWKVMNDDRATGEAFTISDEAIEWRQLVTRLGEDFELPGPILPVPMWCAHTVAGVMERLNRGSTTRPALTHFVVEALGANWSCSSEKIRQELGYRRRFYLSEAFDETIEWLRAQGPLRRVIKH